ncbi:MAG: LPS assembly lipoprotein LptE [Caldimicrobium sp.]|nr:LPS assembly lipoprotein LptE [Caldimicrobium sp.]
MLLSILLFSCGYSLLEKPTYFKPHWQRVFIPPFKNYTQEPELGEMIAYDLRHKFAQGRFLMPVYSEAEADLILKGEILRIYIEPISYEVFLQTRERKLLFEGKFELIERQTQQKVHENPKLSRFETYRVSQVTTGLLEPGKTEALRRLSKDIAELIFQDILFR